MSGVGVYHLDGECSDDTMSSLFSKLLAQTATHPPDSMWLSHQGTDPKGHWVTGKYVVASDSHMRWWMSEGVGKEGLLPLLRGE